jgi:hypothetical protein
MMRRTLLASLVLLASTALVAAGCGGGGGGGGTTTTTLTKAQYAAKLDSICEATNKAGQSLDLSSTAKLAANGDKGKELLDKMVDQIDSLQAPDAVKTQAQSFLDGVKKEASLFGDLTQAAKDGDTAKIKDIDGKLASDAAATSEDARFIGATGCARLLS